MAVRYFRKIIRITAEDSPNVRLAMIQRRAGVTPTNEVILPGVLPWADFLKRLATWDSIRQTIGLRAQFYKGAETLLYPPDWLDLAEQYAMVRPPPGNPKWMGVDPGEGVANSAWSIIDAHGLLRQVAFQTPDTTEITTRTVALAKEFNIPDRNIAMDRGGGGKQIADGLRKNHGMYIRTVGFGESVTPALHRGLTPLQDRREQQEERYTYTTRRSQMYGLLRESLDPNNPLHFALPSCYYELRRQLSPIPLIYDGEGRLILPPKNHRGDVQHPGKKSLTQLIGRSPDEADSLVLALFVRLVKDYGRRRAGPPK